jgi:DNA-binding MarR family transcriptional regulator
MTEHVTAEQAANPTRAGQPGSDDDLDTGAQRAAARAWSGMRALVLDRHDRRKEVGAALGMSFFRAKALRRLARGQLTMRELTAELATDPPYTTLVVNGLEARGLVRRAVHPADRRVKVVSLTPEGRRMSERADAILNEPPTSLLALDPDDLAALDRIIGALLRAGGASETDRT